MKRPLIAIIVLAAVCGVGITAALSQSSSGAAPASSTAIVTAPSSGDAHSAWLKFAACMTSHGAGKVTVMPGSAGGVMIRSSLPRNPTRAQLQAFDARVHVANAACHNIIRPYSHSSSGSGQDEAKFRDGMLRYTRCLRSHGVTVGDPIVKRVSGGFDVSFPSKPGSTSQSGLNWRKAAAVCRSFNPLVNP